MAIEQTTRIACDICNVSAVYTGDSEPTFEQLNIINSPNIKTPNVQRTFFPFSYWDIEGDAYVVRSSTNITRATYDSQMRVGEAEAILCDLCLSEGCDAIRKMRTQGHAEVAAARARTGTNVQY